MTGINSNDVMISIVLPVYNPAAGWADIVLSKSQELMSRYPDMPFEFIVVDDGSVPALFREGYHTFDKGYIRIISYQRNQGKGHALRTGVAAATGALVIYTDVDFPYTIQSICSVIAALRGDRADVVIGIKDSAYYSHVPAFRRFVSRLLRLFVRIFFHISTDDFMCGLKGFNQKGKAVFMQTKIDRYLFDLEFMKLLAVHPEVKTETLEVHLKEHIEFRKMNPGLILSELKDLFGILFKSYKKK